MEIILPLSAKPSSSCSLQHDLPNQLRKILVAPVQKKDKNDGDPVLWKKFRG